jgi:hypothetical protein
MRVRLTAMRLTVNEQAYLCRTPLLGVVAVAFRAAGVASRLYRAAVVPRRSRIRIRRHFSRGHVKVNPSDAWQPGEMHAVGHSRDQQPPPAPPPVGPGERPCLGIVVSARTKPPVSVIHFPEMWARLLCHDRVGTAGRHPRRGPVPELNHGAVSRCTTKCHPCLPGTNSEMQDVRTTLPIN